MKEQIKSLLGRGLSPAEVASAVGADPSYISQLMADEQFRLEVQSLRAAATAQYLEHDDEMDKAESAALRKVAQLAQFVTRAGEAARVFSVLNAAKRRATAAAVTSQAPTTNVIINLPQAALAQVSMQVSTDKQVVEIEGRSMVTMPAKSLAAQLENRRAQQFLTMQIPKTLASQL